jgi:NAD+ kinase
LAPHSLSFRPLILPENCTIRLHKPDDGRTSAWVSLDGATRFELCSGECLIIKASKHALAFVTDPVENLTKTWSCKLTRLLHWNIRPSMKKLEKRETQKDSEKDSED